RRLSFRSFSGRSSKPRGCAGCPRFNVAAAAAAAEPGRSASREAPMGRKRGPRFKYGLPRGGLGRLGWLPSLGSLAAAWFLRVDLAVGACLLAVPVCVWCALGLRKDDAAGEVSDQYVDEESLDWKELLWGNFEHPVRRSSNVMITLSIVACAIAECRWLWG